MVPLDILSDPICPWCYIGKARLDAAIARTGMNPFVVSWRMYRLNPDMPPEGMDRRDYLEAKFGGTEKAAQVYGAIAAAAEDTGLDLALDRIERTPDTLDAHRLLHWAEAEGRQNAVADRLFERYFERAEDISDRDVLLEIADQSGLDRAVIDQLLAGDADREDLVARETNLRGMGVTGVPTFVINGRYVLQGAQESETWERLITELDAAMKADAAELDGDAGAGPPGTIP